MTATRLSRWPFAFLVTILVLHGITSGKELRAARIMAHRPGMVGPGGQVSLPYMVNDNAGNNWRIYQGGWLQQQGNQPLYSQGAMLMVNGNQLNQNNNGARLDEKTGEVIFENMQAPNGFTVTRRVLIDKEAGLVRYVDVVKNNGNAEQTMQFQIQTNLNYGINVSQIVTDPKKPNQQLAWVAQTGAGPSVVEVYGGKGAKSVPSISAPQGNSFVQATMPVTLAAGNEAAIVHLHGTAPSQDAGVNFVNGIKEKELLKSLPKEIRKLVINFRVAQAAIGDIEILRGDLLDVVELRSGDQVKGTLKETAFGLQTFYGPVEVPVDRVVGMINVGRFRPRQLVVTADGQIFGGALAKQTLDLQLSSGQVTQVPLSQITRVGYRKREGEPEEWTFERPIVLLRTGERVGVALPAGPLEVQTRYGKLALPPAAVASVNLQAEEHGVHEIQLVDGSKFAGLLSAEQFDMTLEGLGGGAVASGAGAPQAVKFPTSTVAKIQFTTKIDEDNDDAPKLELANEDLLVGSLAGQLKLDTAFDTITINASEIKSMDHPTLSSPDVAITLWDGTTLGGQLQDQAVRATLGGGVEISVPVALLVSYEQPQPQPAVGMVEQIKATMAKLNADDWKERDRAEAQLVSMGPVAIGTLKKLRTNQPAEAQQRIDSILKQLEKQKATQKSSGAAAPNQNVQQQQMLLPQFDGDVIFDR